MPTISVETTPALSARARRAVAVPVTRWLTEHGVRPAHVVLRFSTAREASIYSGALPLEAMPRDDGGLHHARVVCRIAPDRDADFRAGLAQALATALALDEHTVLFTVEFRDTDPAQVYLADGPNVIPANVTPANVTPANGTTATTPTPQPCPSETSGAHL